MTSTKPTLGFWVRGHQSNARRVVDWQAAFDGHCACSKINPDEEAYLSHFTYPSAFQSHHDTNGSERGYDGPCRASWLFWDIDQPYDPERARTDARRLLGSILNRYHELDEDDLLVFFSGSKGYHVGIPSATFGAPDASPEFHETAKRFALAHAERAGVAIDPLIYSKTRLFRAPNSRHAKTGLHKRRLSADELGFLALAKIRELASEPAPFDPPSPNTLSPQAVDDWQAARGLAATRAVERRAFVDANPSKLTAFARRFLRDGELDETQRAVSVFRVAAELTEFHHAHGFDALVHALVTDAARDSGLSPSEIKRQVESGIAHARRQGEGGAP